MPYKLTHYSIQILKTRNKPYITHYYYPFQIILLMKTRYLVSCISALFLLLMGCQPNLELDEFVTVCGPTPTCGTRTIPIDHLNKYLANGYLADMDGDGYFGAGEEGASSGCCLIDCNDNDININPDAGEVCDAVDNDCDGIIDKGLLFVDKDGDGYGDVNDEGISKCLGDCDCCIENNLDCNDIDSLIFPGSAELCCDSINNTNLITYYIDFDGDGLGSSIVDPFIATYVMPAAGMQSACTPSIWTITNVGTSSTEHMSSEGCGYTVTIYDGVDTIQGVTNNLDCNDLDPKEWCKNCTLYQDYDGDGFGNPDSVITSTTELCIAIECGSGDCPPYVLNNFDCNDQDGDIPVPGAGDRIAINVKSTSTTNRPACRIVNTDDGRFAK